MTGALPWKGGAGWAKREHRAGDRLPYRRLLDEGTLELRDGSLMRSIHVPGMAFETADADELNHAQGVREMLLRSTLDARFVLYRHIIRRPVKVGLVGSRRTRFAADGRAVARAPGKRRLFVNEQFLTLVRPPARGKTGWPERLALRLGKSGSRARPRGAARLDAAIDRADRRAARLRRACAGRLRRAGRALLGAAGAALGAVQRRAAPGARPRAGRRSRPSHALFAGQLRAGRDRDPRSDAAHLRRHPVDQGISGTTRPGLIDGCCAAARAGLTESFAPADRQIAKERMDLAIRRLRATDEEADHRAARDAGRQGRACRRPGRLRRPPPELLVRSTLDQLDDAMAEAGAALADLGAVAVREDVNLEPAFWGQFPGNEAYLVRRALISSANAAGFISLHGFRSAGGRQPLGRGGHPVRDHQRDALLLQLPRGRPRQLHRHRPVGLGQDGGAELPGRAGAAVRAAHDVFRQGPRRGDLRARNGGHYARLSPGSRPASIRCALPDTPANRAFLRDWLGVLLQVERAEELRVIAAAVDACFEHDPAFRRLRHFRELLAGNRGRSRATSPTASRPGSAAGEHAWLFDNADDELDLDRKLLGFDMTALLDNPRLRTPTMMYLFHRIDERLTASRR
jgi:type IV secretion system protein VirB4